MADIIYENFFGPVIRVDGVCYNFWKEVPDDPTQDPPPDALFDTCEECGPGSSASEISSSSGISEIGSSSGISVPVIDCNVCDPQIDQYFTVTLSGLTGSIWEEYEGSHTLTWSHDCIWFDSTGFIYLLWYTDFAGEWVINAASPYTERAGQVRWTGPSDACNPVDSYGGHSSCQDVPGASDCSGLGTTSCIVTTVP